MPNEENENVEFMDTPNQESQDGLEDFDEGQRDDERVAEPQDQAQHNVSEAEPVAPQFSHPHLQGKTAHEIEALFNLMQNTVQSQTRRINELASAPPPSAPEPVTEPKGDFFDDPLTHMRRELQAAVAPINSEIMNLKAQAKVNQAWEAVAMKFGDFDKVRPHVEVMLSNMGVEPSQVTPDLLESLYYGAKGYIATHQPGDSPQETTTTKPAPTNQRPAPPQHRPSSAPLPRSASSQPRQLTEDERRLAREFGMTPEQWIEWGEKNESEVANAEAK